MDAPGDWDRNLSCVARRRSVGDVVLDGRRWAAGAFFTSTTFDIGGIEVGVGRQRGGPLRPSMRLVGNADNPPSDQVSQVTKDGVTLLVATLDDEIRACVFDSLRYDSTKDTGI
jgi:hypothetical protein